MMQEYKVGTKAFIDSFGGAVACVVTAVHHACRGDRVCHNNCITVKVTETKAGYTKGEVVNRDACNTPPLKQRYLRDYHYRINTLYKYVS